MLHIFSVQVFFETIHQIDLGDNDVKSTQIGFPIPIAGCDIQAFNGVFRVQVTWKWMNGGLGFFDLAPFSWWQIQKSKNEKGSDLEILYIYSKEGSLLHTFNLTDLDLHGSVYFDAELGGIAINENSDKIAYIAEKKTPKSSPFLKTVNPTAELDNEDRPRYGEEFNYKDEFGEQMVGKSAPVIVLLDLSGSEPMFEVPVWLHSLVTSPSVLLCQSGSLR